MTVKELKEELNNYPDDMLVGTYDYEGDAALAKDIIIRDDDLYINKQFLKNTKVLYLI